MLFTGLAHGMSEDLQKRSSNVRAELIFTRPGSMSFTSSSANLSTKYVELFSRSKASNPSPGHSLLYPSGSFGVDQAEGTDGTGSQR